MLWRKRMLGTLSEFYQGIRRIIIFFLGIHWKGKWYHDACLPMGLASSCKHFENFSTAIEWIARNMLDIPDIIPKVLDDILIIDKTLSACGNRLHRFLGICADIGTFVSQWRQRRQRAPHMSSRSRELNSIGFNMWRGFLETKSTNAWPQLCLFSHEERWLFVTSSPLSVYLTLRFQGLH